MDALAAPTKMYAKAPIVARSASHGLMGRKRRWRNRARGTSSRYEKNMSRKAPQRRSAAEDAPPPRIAPGSPKMAASICPPKAAKNATELATEMTIASTDE
jgi:hypothetical protein